VEAAKALERNDFPDYAGPITDSGADQAMNEAAPILVGKGQQQRFLLPALGNRHGLVAGATGTGKTVTLQVLAEGFSRMGTSVFLADVKGDLSGLMCPAAPHPKIQQRIDAIGITDYRPQAWPVAFWDIFGQGGHRVRTTISEVGPLLLANLLELNEAQEGILNIAFRVADDEGLLLLDMEDLRQMLRFVAEQRERISAHYGNVATASVAAIQRRLLVLEDQGGAEFFGEPALQLADLMRRDANGLGQVNILAADQLILRPRLYSTFLLWLLSELFENLPEKGDPERPELVFFFDEAHLLFNDAPRSLLEKVEQVVRLIRSKGVGIYFITQNPLDVPDTVLGQLGNRIQHALRAFTPRDQKAVRAAAQTFRSNPELDTETVITQLGVGEALVSMLDTKGVPNMVDRCLVCPPASRIGPATAQERAALMSTSAFGSRYDRSIDRESAAEILLQRAEKASGRGKKESAGKKRSSRQGAGEAMFTSLARSIGTQLGRSLMRGMMGVLNRKR
jgi:DNA helicase HerA-like ATPase